MVRLKKLFSFMFILILLSGTFFPLSADAMGGSAAIVAVLYKIWDWAQNQMMNEMQQFQQGQTDQLKDKAEAIFEKKAHWEAWPATLRELFVEQAVKLEDAGNKAAYQNAQDFLNYAQGNLSGVNAAEYPARATYNFNVNYQKVQQMNPACQLNVPQPIGDSDNKCLPAQQQFTNYLLTGVHPIPNYPKFATNTSDGQAYIQAKNVSETRIALAQVALNQANNPQTNQFIQYMQKNLQSPSIAQINQESPAAVARDTLILTQAKAIIALKQYEVALMNEQLLATILAQNESLHLARLRELSQSIH